MRDVLGSLGVFVLATALAYYFSLRFGALKLGYGDRWRQALKEHPVEIIEAGLPKIGLLRFMPLLSLGLFVGSLFDAIFNV